MDVRLYKKIIVLGNSGSGKSYFSKKLAEYTELPLFHLDCEFWQPGWVKTPREEWITKQQAIISGEGWIIDGNYNSTMEIRFQAAELVVFLDINRWVCLISAFMRHGKKRSDLPEYLEERLDGEFLEFCGWIWNFNKTGRNTIMTLHDKYADKPFLHIKNRGEVKNTFLSITD